MNLTTILLKKNQAKARRQRQQWLRQMMSVGLPLMHRNIGSTLASLLIAAMFLVGAVLFFRAINANGQHAPELADLTVFIPAIVSSVGVALFRLFSATGWLLESYGLQVLMVLLAFIASVVLFVLGILSSNEGNKSALFSFAGTALGFSLGIPVGSWKPSRKRTEGSDNVDRK